MNIYLCQDYEQVKVTSFVFRHPCIMYRYLNFQCLSINIMATVVDIKKDSKFFVELVTNFALVSAHFSYIFVGGVPCKILFGVRPPNP